jgi:hypothetical protein
MVLEPVLCPDCGGNDVVKHGQALNHARLAELESTQTIIRLCQWEDVEAEVDEMWSFVGSKKQQRWLWHAVDHQTGEILADVLSIRDWVVY